MDLFDSFMSVATEIKQNTSKIENVSASIEQLTSISSEISGIVESIDKSCSQMAENTETVTTGTKNNAAMVKGLVEIISDLRQAGIQLASSIEFFHSDKLN